MPKIPIKCIYPTLPSYAGIWRKVNLKEKYVFTEPLRHKQDVTQGQFKREICIYPTPPPQAGCGTIFKRNKADLNRIFPSGYLIYI